MRNTAFVFIMVLAVLTAAVNAAADPVKKAPKRAAAPQPVPEPGTLALLAVGAGAAALAKTCRQARARDR